MLEAVKEAELSPEKLKGYITTMRDSVENELTKANLDPNEDLFLKARLRNYMLLQAFLTAPEKAKASLEKMIAGMVVKR